MPSFMYVQRSVGPVRQIIGVTKGVTRNGTILLSLEYENQEFVILNPKVFCAILKLQINKGT